MHRLSEQKVSSPVEPASKSLDKHFLDKVAGLIIDGLPFCAFEGLVNPPSLFVMQISVPTYADPIQLKTLDRKLARHIL